MEGSQLSFLSSHHPAPCTNPLNGDPSSRRVGCLHMFKFIWVPLFLAHVLSINKHASINIL